ncbi:MAG: hypothetical protein GEU26_16330, partial [Nitrososphaeraceae archaeon]|nr:hypothetical protein [Nitrososphaeraceae archaeon]
MSLTILIAFVVSLFTIAVSVFAVQTSNTAYATISPTASDMSGEVESDSALSVIFDNVSGSIVQVVSITPPLFNLNPQAQNTTEVGAGFIYDDAGHIVTANHVLAGANTVSVVFKDGDRYNATVVGRDAFTDTAVLKIEDNNNTAVPNTVRSSGSVTLGNSSALKIGDHVVTIGYPFASKIA